MSGLGDALMVPAAEQHYAPALSTPPLLLDVLSVPALAVFSALRRLRTAYTGPALRIRRTDNAELDIWFVGNWVDLPAIITHCAGSTGYVKTWYDQSGNGRDVTQATTTKQPIIYAAGALKTLAGSSIVGMLWDGVDDALERADACSLTGNPAMTIAWVSQSTNGDLGNAWTIGQTPGTNGYIAYEPGDSGDSPYGGMLFTGSPWREFAGAVAGAVPSRMIMTHPLSGAVSSFTLESNDFALSQKSAVSGTATPALANQKTTLGNDHTAAKPMAGTINCWCLFGSVIAGADLAALRRELAAHMPPTTPNELLATTDRKAWFRADQGISLNATRISAWANLWGNGNLVQATGGSQPLFEAAGLGGQACSYGDDGNRKLLGLLTSSIPIGSRAYIWIYGQYVTLGTFKYLAGVADPSGAGTANLHLFVYTPTTIMAFARAEAAGVGEQLLLAGGGDATKHLFEVGYTADAAEMAVKGGVNVAGGTLTGTPAVALSKLYAHSAQSGSNSSITRIAEIIISMSEPSAAVKTAMRAYFLARYGSI